MLDADDSFSGLRSTQDHHPGGFRILHLEGDSYQLGYAHGRALKDQLRSLHDCLYSEVLHRRGRLLGWGLSSVMHGLAARMERHMAPHVVHEARGVAAGAGIPYRDVVLMTAFDDVIHNFQFVVPLGRLACSAFAVQRARAVGGRVLLARNLDYYPETDWWGVGPLINQVLRQSLVVFAVKPARGHAFVSIGWPGFLGTVTGLNDAGLAIACLTSSVPAETADGEPAPLIYRRILEEAETLAECEHILRSTRRTIGNNLMVASAKDNAACVLEFSPGMVVKRMPVDDLLTVTNHFQHPATAAEQAGWVVPNSFARHERLRELCAGGQMDIDRAQTVLQDHAAPEECNCIDNHGTIYNTVVDPVRMRLWLRSRGAPGQGFSQLDVAPLLSRQERRLLSA